MKSTLRLFFGILIFGVSLQAFPETQNAIEDIIIKFEQSECGKDEETVIFNAFHKDFPDILEYCPEILDIDQAANYESGDSLCIRAIGYIKISNEAQNTFFKKVLLGLAVIFKEEPESSTLETPIEALYVELLCVDPSWQKKGIGKLLIKAIENHFKPKAIRLIAADAAVDFYKKLGFEFEGCHYNCMIKKL